jgi:hypothetical protein
MSISFILVEVQKQEERMAKGSENDNLMRWQLRSGQGFACCSDASPRGSSRLSRITDGTSQRPPSSKSWTAMFI